MRAFFLILFLTLFASNSLAQTYIYVDVSCTSNNGDGTAGGPNNSTPGSCAASPGGTGPYNTITSAVDDDIDLVTATTSYIIEVAGGTDTLSAATRAVVDGWITSATYTLTITNNGSYTLSADVTNAGILDIRDPYVFVSGDNNFVIDNRRTAAQGTARNLEFSANTGNNGVDGIVLTNSGNNCSAANDACSGIYTGTGNYVGDFYFANVEIQPGFTNGVYFSNKGSSSNADYMLYNITSDGALEHCYRIDISNGSGTNNLWIKNAVCKDSGTQDYSDAGGGSLTSDTADTNHSSDGTTFTLSTITFTDEAGGDYSLASNLTGTNLSTDPDSKYSFSTDIAGTTRSGWSAGAWEYVATGGTADYILFEEY